MNERLRISDAEREAAAHELGEHFALGRITAEEHAERLEQVWAARTSADLAPAFRDLPRPQPARSTRSPRDRRPELPRLPFPFKVLVMIVLVWWGFHHPLFLLLAVIGYAVLLRPLIHRPRWRDRPVLRIRRRWLG
jgi:ferric-dicitrate binding protein FerR (iron transport regulator)